MSTEFDDFVESLPLVDHHVHGAMLADVDRGELESMLTESDRPPAEGTSTFDSQVGFAVRRWCAPVLDLAPHASADDYVARRRELGAEEVTRRFLRGSGIGHFLIETGYQGDVVADPATMAGLSERDASEVVRLEAVAEDVARGGCNAGEFAERFGEELHKRAADAVGLKSVVAYRYGLDFDPERPTAGEVENAAGDWLRRAEGGGDVRLDHPALLRHLLWTGVDTGLPLQLHIGYGDPDLELHRCNPALLTRWLKQMEPSGTQVMLLHCYPYHREAGYLAQVFPHVYFDVGLAVNYTGARASAVVAESLELAPFGKLLFSSDAWGPAELHYLGALLWRRAISRVVGAWIDEGEWSAGDAQRAIQMVGVENAQRVYRLGGDS